MVGFRIYALSEQAITIEFDQKISTEANDRVMRLHQALSNDPFPGFQESVPAYSSLTVFFDLSKIPSGYTPDTTGPIEYVSFILENRMHESIGGNPLSEQVVEIPVCYDITLAPDLHWVSEYCRLTIPEVIKLHTGTEYRVYMIGFVPGFPYLGSLPSALEVPRKESPSLSIPAGSVALAGRQTGIYPFDIPGGWRVIGRTPLRLFDANREPFSLLKAGMSVRFVEINISEFLQRAGS